MENSNPKFPVVEFDFDPKCDIEEVDQFGFADLRQAFLTGTIDGSLAPESGEYNGIDEPDAILPAAKDVFERTRQYQRIRDAASKSSAASPAGPAEAGSATPSGGGE